MILQTRKCNCPGPVLVLVLVLALPGACGEAPEGGQVVRLTRIEGVNATSLRTALAPDGGVFVALISAGASDLGGGPLGEASLAVNNLLLARYDAEHRHLWSQAVGPPLDRDLRVGLTLLDGDPVLTLEGVSGDLSLGGDVLEGPVVPESTGAMARYDGADGGHLWSRLLSDDGMRLHPRAVVASGERLFVTGAGQRTGELPVGVVAAYGPDGSTRWQVAPWEGTMLGSRVVVTDDGSLVVSADNAFEIGRQRGAVLRLEAEDGAVRWAADCPHPYSGGMELAVMPSGDILTAESIFVTADLATLPDVVSVDRLSGVDGRPRWSWILGTGLSEDSVQQVHVTADRHDNAVISGAFLGTVLIGERVVRSSEFALFVMSTRPDGVARWSRHTGRTPGVQAADLHVTDDGTILATGLVGGFTQPQPDDALFFLELTP